MPTIDSSLVSGKNGEYKWLVTDYSLDELIGLVPAIILGRFLAVTSFDSGPLNWSEAEHSQGWVCRNGISYSSEIRTLEGLPYGVGYEEWYVLDAARDIGSMRKSDSNPFERPADSHEIFAFVNSHMGPDHKDSVVLEMFWRDLRRINPLSYLSDNASRTTFATTDHAFFAATYIALNEAPQGSLLER